MKSSKLLSVLMAIGLVLSLSASTVLAAAEIDNKPVRMRAIGGAAVGGTWNIAYTAVAKLLNDQYPGSQFDVLLGASVSNPLRLENNTGELTCTQSFNIRAGLAGKEPYTAPFKNVMSIANINDTTYMQVIARSDVAASSLDEIVEKKMPVRIARGAKGTLHDILGTMYLEEMGVTWEDFTKWGGTVTVVPSNDITAQMQDNIINLYFNLGSADHANTHDLVNSTKVKWLPISDKVLQKIAARTGLQIGAMDAKLYNGAVGSGNNGQDVPCMVDVVHMIVHPKVSESDVYKITKAMAEGYEYIRTALPAWKTLDPKTMPLGLAAPMHPGAERYYREVGLMK